MFPISKVHGKVEITKFARSLNTTKFKVKKFLDLHGC